MKRQKYIVNNRPSIAKHAWDAFVDASDEAWLWHRYDLQDALVTWGKKDLSFAVHDSRSGEILAVVPLHLLEGKVFRRLPWNRFDSLGAPALRNGLGRKHRSKILQFIQDTLLHLAQQYDVVEINLALCPMAPAFRGNHCPRVNPLLELGYENTLTQTWVVDLQRFNADIRTAYSKLTHRELKKIAKIDFEIREAFGRQDLEIYYDLHCETYNRTGVRPHPFKYFEYIFEEFIPKKLSRIIFLVCHGKVKAAQNTALYKEGAVYWTGASRSDKPIGSNRVLFDNQIMYSKNAGCQWYETGEAFLGLKTGKLKGLNDFKKSFGGGLYPFYRGRIIPRRKIYHLQNLYTTMCT